MTANIASLGVDLDILFAAHVTNNAANPTGYEVGGIDLQTRYDPLSAPEQSNLGSRIPLTGITSSATGWSNTDMSAIFCGNAGQYSLTTPSGGTKDTTTGWSSPKIWTHTIILTFSTASDLTNYFFYGGRVQISATQGSGTPADNALSAMFTSMGTLVIYDLGHYRTGAGGTISSPSIGGSNISTTPTTIYSIDDGSPYTATNYSVSMVANAVPGAATVLTITTTLNTVTAGGSIDVYSGIYTSVVQQRNHPTQSVPVFTGNLL